MRRAWTRNGASPSFRLIELTTPLPCTHFSPASQHGPAGTVDHDRERATSGSVAIRVQEGGHGLLALEQVSVHVHVEEVRSPAHLLQGDVHGGPGGHRPLDEPPEPADPVTLVRSPIITKPGVRADREGLQAAEAGPRRRTGQRAAAACRTTAAAIGAVVRRRCPAAAADDVDQPGAGEVGEQPGGLLRRLVVAAERVREAGVRVAGGVRCRPAGTASPRIGRISSAPREQFTPTTSGLACPIAVQNPSTVLPGQGPPAAVHDRDRDPQRQVRGDLAGSGDRGLGVQRVEDRLSISSRSTPPSARAWICSA